MTEEKKPQDRRCKSNSHTHHLCHLLSQDNLIKDVEKYNSIVNDPRYKCLYCGRVAKELETLCVPEEL